MDNEENNDKLSLSVFREMIRNSVRLSKIIWKEKKKSIILISHRFSTTRHADKIAVIADETLKEYGRHEDLIMKKNGIYSHLFNLQAKGYK